MLEAIDIRKYLAEYGSSVNEDYGWVLNIHIQCVEYGVPFHFHQTGARLRRSVPDGHGGHILKIYEIPREYQHTQAEKAGLDYGGGIEIPASLSADSLSICKEPEERSGPVHFLVPGKDIAGNSCLLL